MNDSVTERADAVDLKRTRRRAGGDRRVSGVNIDRLPPNAPECEQGALGCQLETPAECIPEAIAIMGDTFKDVYYDLRHQTIQESICELYKKQIGIDLITVQQHLKERNLLEQVGGIAYLSKLQEMVFSSTSNLPIYLQKLKEKHTLRKLISVCSGTIGRIYDNEGDFEQLLDEVEKDIHKATDQGGQNKQKGIKELVNETLVEIESIVNRKGEISGISTGFADLDKMTNGLHGGEMIIVAARPSMGKAQPLDAKVLTASGFVKMGSLKIGDFVIGKNGTPIEVLGTFDQGQKEVFKVEFSDGTKTRCCKEHLWFTRTRDERRRGIAGSVKNLKEIIATIHRTDGGMKNHVVPLVNPINFIQLSKAEKLPLHPWVLGALIGDGGLTKKNIEFHKPENDVQEKLINLLPADDIGIIPECNSTMVRIKRKKRSNAMSETRKAVEAAGLNVFSEDKFIPPQYLTADVQSRIELLQGLLDTDGYVIPSGAACEFSSSSKKLAENVAYLARSLGAICSEAKPKIPKYFYKGEKKTGLISYRMNIWFDGSKIIPVSSEKHLKKWKSLKQRCRHVHKSIAKITSDGYAECRCIKVNSADGLYVTDDFIVTHNTSLSMNIAEHVALELGLPVGVFSLEMSASSLTMRMVCSLARVNLRSMQQGWLNDSDYPKIMSASSRLAAAPLHIDDESGLSIMQLRARARRMVQQHGIKLFVIDYLQLLNSNTQRAKENRQQEVADISSGIKAMAKELNVPVIVLSQLNREMEKDKNRKPRLSDLRESGAVEQDADLVGLLYKPKTGEDDDEIPEESDGVLVNLLIAKQRNGPTGEVNLTFLKPYTRFESAARITEEDLPMRSTSSDP